MSPPSAYTEVVRELNEQGWHVITHAVGDAALDEVLDGYAAAERSTPIKGKRWSVEHAFVSRPEQVARLKNSISRLGAGSPLSRGPRAEEISGAGRSRAKSRR